MHPVVKYTDFMNDIFTACSSHMDLTPPKKKLFYSVLEQVFHLFMFLLIQ